MLVDMAYLIGIALLVAVVWAIVHAVSTDRYSTMTEAEFEAEARRGSALGSAVVGLQNILEPQRKVEYLQQRDKHVEADSSESGPKPSTD